MKWLACIDVLVVKVNSANAWAHTSDGYWASNCQAHFTLYLSNIDKI